MLLCDFSEPAGFVNPSIRRQHVDVPGLRFDRCIDSVEVGENGGVALDRRGVVADRSDCLIQFGLTAARDEHPRAFLGKPLGNAEADTGAAAGDESDFACELAGHGHGADRSRTFEKSAPSPSAIVGGAITASRSLEYGRAASTPVFTPAMNSRGGRIEAQT